LAAWAGGLAAHVTFSIDPNDFAFTKAVQILVFAVVGGIPNVVGPILGATVFTALPELLRPFKDYRDIFQGAILLAVIIYLPRGIVTLAELRKTLRLAKIGAAAVAGAATAQQDLRRRPRRGPASRRGRAGRG